MNTTIIVLLVVFGVAAIMEGLRKFWKDVDDIHQDAKKVLFCCLLGILGIVALVLSHRYARICGTRGVITSDDLPSAILRVVVQGSTLNGQNVVVLENAEGDLYCVKVSSTLDDLKLPYVKRWRITGNFVPAKWELVPADHKKPEPLLLLVDVSGEHMTPRQKIADIRTDAK